MPASSVDTFFACSIMIVLVLSAMATTASNLRPSIDDLQHRNDAERFQQLAQHLLLAAGSPANWGSLQSSVPDTLGLAKSGSALAYTLDIDKVTRLNSDNAYALVYAQLWQSFGVTDISFRTEVKTLFTLSTTLMLTTSGINETTYQFDLYAHKSGLPVSAVLHSYVVVQDYVNSVASSTAANGHASASVSLPNAKNGTALLLTIAKAESNPQIVAFSVYAFSHNNGLLQPNQTFTQLNPLDYVINATFTYPNEQVVNALVLTYNYNFSLTMKSQGAQTIEYNVPRLVDASPILLVITGFNQSSSFAEWVSYPQVPLQIGPDFSQAETGAKTVSFSHIVTINSALYEVATSWGGIP